MRALLSTIGSRGDVQPLVALAHELRGLGHEAHLCVPPDFRAWIEGLGFTVTPIGPEVRKAGAAAPRGATPQPSPEQLQQAMKAMVAGQMETVGKAADGCDVIVGATALQIATRSVAERLGIPYVFVAYCPTVLPSAHHAPAPLISAGQRPAPPDADFAELWKRNGERFQNTFGAALNGAREAAGLPPVHDVRSHVFTDRPWLAADPTLGPWPDRGDEAVVQTGAWILPDERPLSAELEAFLGAGEPPIYFGLGSMHVPADDARSMIEAARALGRRAIVSRGWAELVPVDDAPDCLSIDEVNQQTLFTRVAAVVHHGGAGTTTAAARSGTPQVVLPHLYDQHYWAGRVQELGAGVAHALGDPSADSLRVALERALSPEVAEGARALAGRVRSDGARMAARRLIETQSSTTYA